MQVEPLVTYLQGRQNEMVNLLRRLVEAESPSSLPERQEPVLTILSETLTALDFAVERIPGKTSAGQLMAWPRQHPRPNLSLDLTPDSAENHPPIQLLIGHCDTVWPLGTLEKMPFRVDDNRIMGPGVYDMKGGLVQMLTAFQAVQEMGSSLSVVPVVFINTDEELGSQDSSQHIHQLAKQANRAFILEPSLGTSGKLKTRRKGVGRFQFHIQGQAAHAGLDPDKGVSAILELAYLIQKLHALNDRANGVSVNVGVINGGTRPNVIAPTASAEIDVRVPTRETADHIEQALKQITPHLDGITLELTGWFNRLPLEKTRANERLWDLAQTEGHKLGLELEEGTAGGGSDGNTTSLYTATLDGLGAVGDGAHAAHEFLFIDKMIERTALLTLLLLSPSL
ncbi:MAG: M20 family metallopeptidase [Candidatus Promineifilaceae bacterium]